MEQGYSIDVNMLRKIQKFVRICAFANVPVDIGEDEEHLPMKYLVISRSRAFIDPDWLVCDIARLRKGREEKKKKRQRKRKKKGSKKARNKARKKARKIERK